MKRLHMWWIAAAALLTFSTGWGFIWIFANQGHLPKGVTAVVSGTAKLAGEIEIVKDGRPVPLGGMKVEEAIHALRQHAQAIEGLTLAVEANGTMKPRRTWTMARLVSPWIRVKPRMPLPD